MSISSHKSPSQIIIIGAGPAGMSSALAGIRAGHKVIVIDMGQNDGSYYHVQGNTHFEKGAGGILGIDNFWGAQLIHPTERDIQNFRHLAGDYVVDEIMRGVQEIQDFLKLEIHKDNKYPEVDFSISDQLPHQFGLIHSKFLPNRKLINYFRDLIDSDSFTYIEKKVISLNIDENYVLQAVSFDDNTNLDTSSSKVVIALGALESTRIIVKSLNIKNSFPILDHPQSLLCKVHATSSKFLRKPSHFKHKGSFFKRKFLYTNDQREGILELQEDLSLNLNFLLSNSDLFIKRILNRIARALNLNYLFTPDTYSVWIQTDQKMSATCYIRLQDQEIHENWSPSSEDAEFALEILKSFSSLSSILKLETHDSELQIEEVLNLIQHANHPSSSLQLSSYFSNIFSDFGKIRPDSNFTVASAAVFPSSGWLNPTLLIMGMAYSFTINLIVSP